MEKRKGEDEGGGHGGRALAMQESGWYVALVILMNLLRHISYCDMVPPSGVTGGGPASIGSCTCSG